MPANWQGDLKHALQQTYRNFHRASRDVDAHKLAASLRRNFGISAKVQKVREMGQTFQVLMVPNGDYFVDGNNPDGALQQDYVLDGNGPDIPLPPADSVYFVDGNGNGALDAGDYDFSCAIEVFHQKYGWGSCDLGPPRDGQGTDGLMAMMREMPSADGQTSYPRDEIAQLFAQARSVAIKSGGVALIRVMNALTEFLSCTREERRITDKMRTLRFRAPTVLELAQALAEQARLMESIQRLREQRVLPLLEKVAQFSKRGTW